VENQMVVLVAAWTEEEVPGHPQVDQQGRSRVQVEEQVLGPPSGRHHGLSGKLPQPTDRQRLAQPRATH
jgi:hypothetical protein